eukprot:c18849_g1_i2.p1 GENE.c18849_g1_i2~~c18849_g1_i2.p1  ORF type:complete len:1038 (+),score=128.23 c18849_g1_i2:64-3177(+)
MAATRASLGDERKRKRDEDDSDAWVLRQVGERRVVNSPAGLIQKAQCKRCSRWFKVARDGIGRHIVSEHLFEYKRPTQPGVPKVGQTWNVEKRRLAEIEPEDVFRELPHVADEHSYRGGDEHAPDEVAETYCEFCQQNVPSHAMDAHVRSAEHFHCLHGGDQGHDQKENESSDGSYASYPFSSDDSSDDGVSRPLGRQAAAAARPAGEPASARRSATRGDDRVHRLPVIVPTKGLLSTQAGRDFATWSTEFELSVAALDTLALGVGSGDAFTRYRTNKAIDSVVASVFNVVTVRISVQYGDEFYFKDTRMVTPLSAILFFLSSPLVVDTLHLQPLVEPAFAHAASPCFRDFYRQCVAKEKARPLGPRVRPLPVRLLSLSLFTDGASVAKFAQRSLDPISLTILNQDLDCISTSLAATLPIAFKEKDRRFRTRSGRPAPDDADLRRLVGQEHIATILEAVPLRIEVEIAGHGLVALYMFHPLLRGDMVTLSGLTGIPFNSQGCACLMCVLPRSKFSTVTLGKPRTVPVTLRQEPVVRSAEGHSAKNAAQGSRLFAFHDSLGFDVFQGLGLPDRLHNLDLGIGREIVEFVVTHIFDAASLLTALRAFRLAPYERFAKMPRFDSAKRLMKRAAHQTGAHTHGLLIFFLHTISGQDTDAYYRWGRAGLGEVAVTTIRRFIDLWHVMSSAPNSATEREGYLRELELRVPDLVRHVLDLNPALGPLPKLHALLHLPHLVRWLGSALHFELGASERRLQEYAGAAFKGVGHRGELTPMLLRWLLRRAIVRHCDFASEALRLRLYKAVDEPRMQLVRAESLGVAHSKAPVLRLGSPEAMLAFGYECATWMASFFIALGIARAKVQRSRSALVGTGTYCVRVRADDNYLGLDADGERRARHDDVVYQRVLEHGVETGHSFGTLRACFSVWDGKGVRSSALLIERRVPLLTPDNNFALHRLLGEVGLVSFASTARERFDVVLDEGFAFVRPAHFVAAIQPFQLGDFGNAPDELPQHLTTERARLVRSVLGGTSVLVPLRVTPTHPES